MVKTIQFNEMDNVVGTSSSRVILQYLTKVHFTLTLLLYDFSFNFFQMFLISFKYLKMILIPKTEILRYLNHVRRGHF